MILSNQAQSSGTQNLTSREDDSKLKCWFETFDFNLPKSQTKRIKPKYFATIIKLKNLKSMIFERQNHILREFRVLKSFKSKKQKTTYEKKERKKNVILIVENEKK
ncbi:hypothetical protein ACB098_05G166100 [Castanea mollissima]